MGAPYGYLRSYAYELAGDGEWHDREDLLDKLIPLVPPGPAYQRAELDRTRQVEKRKDRITKIRARPADDEAIMRTGQRTIARDVLNGVRWEHRVGEDGRKQVRLRPMKPHGVHSHRRNRKPDNEEPHELQDAQ